MSAKDYKITFGFKAVDGYYYGLNGTVGPFHHGEDRAMPTGTSVITGGHKIALSGNSGLSGGAHLHVDKRPIGQPITNRYAFVRPTGWQNLKGGKVVFAGPNGSAGNTVSIHYKGYEYRFLHLSKILVKVGDKIGVNMTQEEVALAYKLDGRKATANDKKFHSSKGTPKSLLTGLIRDSAKAGNVKKISDLKKSLAKVQTALKNEKNKPPKEVIKEVEKIVEKEVEVIKEVEIEKPTTWNTVLNFFVNQINKLLRRK